MQNEKCIYRGGPTSLTQGQLLKELEDVFTKRGLVPRLLSKFWARDQLMGESLAAYSHDGAIGENYEGRPSGGD